MKGTTARSRRTARAGDERPGLEPRTRHLRAPRPRDIFQCRQSVAPLRRSALRHDEALCSNFVLGKIEDNENVLVSIGSGLAVKKKRIDAIGLVVEKLTELEVESRKNGEQIQKIANSLMKLQNEIEEMRQ